MSKRASTMSVVRRRGLLAGAAALPLLASGGWLAAPCTARAATPLPAAVSDLDQAAMALFNAAEAGEWNAARTALERARAAAAATDTLDAAYVQAGGDRYRFFEGRNGLRGDLVEARTALSVKDSRWLVSTADRILAHAGELALPFAMHANVLVPRLEALLSLARRMRRARVWNDASGYEAAQQDFDTLWKALRGELGGKVATERMRALDDALRGLTSSATSGDLRRLYDAVAALRADV
jgi:hypothetical protein